MASTLVPSKKQGRQDLEALRPMFIHPERALKAWGCNDELAHVRDPLMVQSWAFNELNPAAVRQLTDDVQSELYRELYGAIGLVRLGTEAAAANTQASVSRHVSLKSAFEDLDELTDLEPDWDSYGGLPPSSKAVSTAGRLMVAVGERLRSSVGEAAAPYSVMPIADGGVQVEWRGQTEHIEVNIGPKGSIGYLLIENPGGEPKFRRGRQLSVADAIEVIEGVPHS